MPVQSFEAFYREKNISSSSGLEPYLFSGWMGEKDRSIANTVLTIIAEEIVANNLNVISIGYSGGLIEAYFLQQLSNNQKSAQVIGIGKKGSEYDTKVRQPLLPEEARIDLDESFECTQASIKSLYEERVLPRLTQDDFQNTLLFFSMPPDDGQEMAYYLSEFRAFAGSKLTLYTENLGDAGACTPLRPEEVWNDTFNEFVTNFAMAQRDLRVGPCYYGFTFSDLSPQAYAKLIKLNSLRRLGSDFEYGAPFVLPETATHHISRASSSSIEALTPVQSFEAFYREKNISSSSGLEPYLFSGWMGEKDRSIANTVLTIIAEEIVANNLNVISIGYSGGLIEAYFLQQLSNNQKSAQVIGIGKKGSEYDTKVRQPLLPEEARIDLDESFECTQASIKSLYEERVLPRLTQDDFQNTLLFFSMPPDDGQEMAYYLSEFRAFAGSKLTLYTENLGDAGACTPLRPEEVWNDTFNEFVTNFAMAQRDLRVGPCYYGFTFSDLSPQAYAKLIKLNSLRRLGSDFEYGAPFVLPETATHHISRVSSANADSSLAFFSGVSDENHFEDDGNNDMKCKVS
ncbi:MAG: hypothetical protein P1U36_02060 [Legionellaceae bacterium]|nr:hypothetical protein [Legionellaceae bacterium]